VTDKEVLLLCAADRWRECKPAHLARLTATGHLSCGHLLTNAGRYVIGLPPVSEPDPGHVPPQYAK